MTRYTRPKMSEMTRAWTEATKHFSNSLLEAQQGAFASFGLIEEVEIEDTRGTAYASPEWEFERTVELPSEISVGDSVRFTKTLTDDDVLAFAGASGDTNRLHLEEDFAEETRFGGRIAHGTLVSGLISAALARLPGLTIYLSQDLQFLKPVSIGETLTAETEVLEDLGENKYRLRTDVTSEDTEEQVIKGEAVVLIDQLPKEAEYAAADPEE